VSDSFNCPPNRGNPNSVLTPRGTYGYTYHPTSGLLASIADPDGGTLAFGYDGSLPTSVTWTGEVAGSIELLYDDDFEVTQQTVNGVDPILFAYDDDGLLTGAGDLVLTSSATTGFLEATTLGTTTDALTYTTYGELDVYTASAGSPVLTYDLDRDGGGRITKKTETIGGVTAVWEYHFDDAGRLDEVKKDSVVVETYGYDANSNRTSYSDFWGSGAATYDEQDRLLTYGAASFTYTANGELSTKTEGPDVTTYGYDVFGNLRTVELPTGIEIEYLVDAANRRTGKKVDGTLVQGFLWQSQLQPAAELDGSGNVVARFVYATKPNVPDYMVKAGTTYRLFTDHLGSVRLVVNTTTGAIAQRLDYDPWGRILLDTSPGFQPFGFAGGLCDPQTGFVRFGARDYDPEIGRWTMKDSIGFGGGDTNFFGYVGADPVNSFDPLGLKRVGHHYVHMAIRGRPWLSAEAASVFNSVTTGPLAEPNLNQGLTTAHRAYNAAVESLYKLYLSESGIDETKMTASEARTFIERIRASKNPAIRYFLDNVEAAARAFVANLEKAGKPRVRPKVPRGSGGAGTARCGAVFGVVGLLIDAISMALEAIPEPVEGAGGCN
jgi:RHS repeat-associated protein